MTIQSPTPVAFGEIGENAKPVSSANPMPVAGKAESFQLAAANVASTQATVYGGDYIFSQIASAYGSVKLQCLGPDGSTWLDLITKTAVDANGSGTGLALGNGAVVRAVVAGTTGAYAILARVP